MNTKRAAKPPLKRRYDDRGDAERRARAADASDDWWLTRDTRWAAETEADESRVPPGWPQSPPDANDSRFLSRQTRRIANQGGTTFQRIYRLFVGARAVLSLALLAAQAAGSMLGTKSSWPLLLLSVLYASQAAALWALPRFRARRDTDAAPRLSRFQWLGTIVVDVLAFSALHLLAPGNGFNYVALLVLPVLMAGVLTPRTVALATTSVVALLLLAGAALGEETTLLMTQAGLAGIGLFIITLLAGELAGRLAREELTARGTLELARQQAQLNRLVIEQMAEGVLVIDRRLRVRSANPAARRLLTEQGLANPAPFSLDGMPEWASLKDAVVLAFERGGWAQGGEDVLLRFASGATRMLRLRARFTARRAADAPVADARSRRSAEGLCVMFIDDVRQIEARTRQEKLAAMGRVSAGIAHEIRNPLAAISQANALLQEDVLPPDQQRLTRIVADNAERLKRIVEDVLEVAPGAEPQVRVIDASFEVGEATAEWARTVGLPLGEASRLHVRLPTEPLGVLFDSEHLRRVLVNLLDNAHRHATGATGAVVLSLAAGDETEVLLRVSSDGEPIPPHVERHLFEPFFSTRSRGTGLGLYICRELCERYGARLDYRLRPVDEANRNEFQVTMRRAALARTEARLHL